MNLADLGANPRRGIDLLRQCIDEYTGHDPCIGELCHHRFQACLLPCYVETAFGRDFLPPLGHQHRHFRLERARDLDHFVRRRHFEIELDVHQLAQTAHILVLDMAPVLAQMNRDAIRAAQVCLHRGPYRVGLVRVTQD